MAALAELDGTKWKGAAELWLYPPGDQAIYLRPTDELVLQMTVITPWGEEGRAVRMVFRRA